MTTKNEDQIELNGEAYIKKSSALTFTPVSTDELILNGGPGGNWIRKECVTDSGAANKFDGLEYVMCRTYSAGVFAGYLQKREGKEVTLLKARRIWYWSGAASLSQLATEGTTNPSACKFPCEVERIELMEAIEIIPITAKAEKSIKSVAIWKQ